MSTVISEMLVRIAADTAQLRTEMQSAQGVVSGVVGSIKNSVLGLVGTIGTAQLAREFVQMADQMTLLNARLKLATGGGDDFVKSQKAIYSIAQANNIGLQEATELYTKLYDPVKRLGGGVRENSAIVEAFSASLRVGGANTQMAASATLQFAQAMASGKLSGDEFRAMSEASPRFMTALAEGIGVPTGELKKMGSEGKLTADVVGNALMKSLGTLRAEAASMPDTVGGAFQRMKNDVSLMVDEVNKANGITETLAATIGSANTFVRQIAQAFRDWSAATSGVSSELDGAGILIAVLGKAMETLILLSSDVVFVFKGIGREIGGIAAQVAALFSGDFAAVGAIRDEMVADSKAAREELDKFQAKIAGTTDRILQQRDALKNNSLSSAENSNEMQRLGNVAANASDRLKTLKGAKVEVTDEVKKATAAAKDYIDKLTDQIGAYNQQITLGRELTDAEKEHNKLTIALADGKLKLNQEQEAEARAKIDLIQKLKEEIAQRKELEKTMAAVAALSTKLEAAQIAETEALRKGNVELKDQIEKSGMSEREIVSREVAVLRATATEKEWAASMGEDEGANYQLSEQARLLRERAGLLEQGVAVKEAKAAADEWKKVTDSINDGLTDALMRGFESGKDFFENFKSVLVNAFKTMVLQPTIQAVMSPISGALGNMMSGKGGNPLGAIMDLMNGKTIGSTVGNQVAFGAEGLGNWLMNNTTGGLNKLGGSLMGNAGAIGNIAGMAGNAFAGFGISSALSGGYSLGGKNLVNGIAGIASMIPGIGPIAGVVGGLINRAFGMKAKEMKDYGLEGSITGGDATGQRYQDWFQKGGFFRSNKTGTNYSALGDDLSAALDMGAKRVLEQTKAWADALNLPAESLANVTANFKVKLTENEAENQAAIELIFTGYQTALTEQFAAVLGPFQRAGESIADTMQRLTALQAFSESINEFGGVFSRLANASIDARENVIALAGGIDKLMEKAGQFVTDYYSEGEQAGLQARATLETLRGLGLSADSLGSREDFRRLVESIDVSTKQGQEQLVTLLNLAPQFASLADYLKENKLTLEQVSQQAPVVDILNEMLPEAESTTEAVTDVADRISQGNETLKQIVAAVTAGNANIAAGIAAMASAQQAVASAQAEANRIAASTNRALTGLANDATLTGAEPTYSYDIGATLNP